MSHEADTEDPATTTENGISYLSEEKNKKKWKSYKLRTISVVVDAWVEK